jgi:hypothetical protein
MRWGRRLVVEPTARGTASLSARRVPLRVPRGTRWTAAPMRGPLPRASRQPLSRSTWTPHPCVARSPRASRRPLSRSTWNTVDRRTHARPVHRGTAPDLSPCSTWNVPGHLASSWPAPSGPWPSLPPRSMGTTVDCLVHAQWLHPGAMRDRPPRSTWNTADCLVHVQGAPSERLARPLSTFHVEQGARLTHARGAIRTPCETALHVPRGTRRAVS